MLIILLLLFYWAWCIHFKKFIYYLFNLFIFLPLRNPWMIGLSRLQWHGQPRACHEPTVRSGDGRWAPLQREQLASSFRASPSNKDAILIKPFCSLGLWWMCLLFLCARRAMGFPCITWNCMSHEDNENIELRVCYAYSPIPLLWQPSACPLIYGSVSVLLFMYALVNWLIYWFHI